MAISLAKGQKIKLAQGNANLGKIIVGLGWTAGQGVDLDAAAFLLRADGKISADEDFVFYNQPKRKQNFGKVRGAYIRIIDEQNDRELLRFDLGNKFSVETAVVVGKIYRRRGQWNFSAIGEGFSGGLAALCRNFGVNVSSDNQNASSASPTAASKMPSEIVMQKWEQIELAKSGDTYASIIFEFDAKTSNYCSFTCLSVNPPRFYCVYDAETSWGDRMTHFMPEDNDLGFFNRAPYIAKDSGRDIIRLNGKFADKFNHIVICVDKVYNDWIEMNGVLRIKCPGNPDLVINLDESNKEYRCVLAAIDNIGGTFKVEKIVKFYANDDGIINDFFSDIAR